MTAQAGKLSLLILALFFSTANLAAQTSGFNFQGRLNDGSSPANGSYDFQFKLFNAATGGTQLASTIDRPELQVRDGVFSTQLSFGLAVFLAGEHFLEISVRPSGSPNAFVVLGGRQEILYVPKALRADRATRATTADDAVSLGGVAPSGYVRLNETNTGNLVIKGNTQQTGNFSITEVIVVQNAIIGGNSIVNGNTVANGNTIQPAGSLGFPKALLKVAGVAVTAAFFEKCYNGVTGNSAPGCGFTITEPLGQVGVYRINLGFPINNRFIVATSEYGGAVGGGFLNTVPQYRLFDSTTLEFFLTKIDSPGDTTAANFMVMIF